MKITWKKISPFHQEWFALLDGKRHLTRTWKIYKNNGRFYMSYMDIVNNIRDESDSDDDDDDYDYYNDHNWHDIKEYDDGNGLVFRNPQIKDLKGSKLLFEKIIPMHLKEIQEAIDNPKIVIEND